MANEYGIVITQSGIPVDRSSDYQRVLDSRWRFMEMAFDNEIDVSHTSWQVGYNVLTLYEHNLGFLPAFEFYQDESAQQNPGIFFGDPAYESIWADTTKIYCIVIYQSGGSTLPMRIKGQLRVFNVPITEEYTAPAYGLNAGSGITDTSIGARAIDRDRTGSARMGDEDPLVYSLNTKAKALSVHKTGLAEATTPELEIVHSVGYPPTFYVARVDVMASGFYIHPLDGVQVVGIMTNRLAKTVANTRTITFTGTQSTLQGIKVGYLILKDPVELAQ